MWWAMSYSTCYKRKRTMMFKWLRRLVEKYVDERLRTIEAAMSWQRDTKPCIVCDANIPLAVLTCRQCGSSQLPEKQTTGIYRIPESIRHLGSVYERCKRAQRPEEKHIALTYRRLLINDRKPLQRL